MGGVLFLLVQPQWRVRASVVLHREGRGVVLPVVGILLVSCRDGSHSIFQISHAMGEQLFVEGLRVMRCQALEVSPGRLHTRWAKKAWSQWPRCVLFSTGDWQCGPVPGTLDPNPVQTCAYMHVCMYAHMHVLPQVCM